MVARKAARHGSKSVATSDQLLGCNSCQVFSFPITVPTRIQSVFRALSKVSMLSSIVSVLATAHLLAFSTLLGTELYQTFVVTKVAYQALPRSAFTTLQKRLFPIYFQSQSLLLVLVIATTPPRGPMALTQSKIDCISFLLASATAGLNLVVYGPRTEELMVARVHQGKCSLQRYDVLTSGSHTRCKITA